MNGKRVLYVSDALSPVTHDDPACYRDFYLAYCEAGFDENKLHLWQIELARSHPNEGDGRNVNTLPALVETHPCSDPRFVPREVDLDADGYEPSRCPPSAPALRRWAQLMPASKATSSASLIVELITAAAWTAVWAVKATVATWVE